MDDPRHYSFLVSQILGAFIFILAIVIMGRMYYFRNIVLKLRPQDPIIPVVASFNLLLGITLVMTHNFWCLKPLTWVTIICWLIFIKGLLWLVFPEKMLTMMKKVISGRGYNWTIVALLVIGVVVFAKGLDMYLLRVAH